jgi:hypothetical protein
MDKWEALTNRIKQAALAEEPDAALAGALEMFAEFGRQVERIADALTPLPPVEQHPQEPLPSKSDFDL